jgi:hypothetical protein
VNSSKETQLTDSLRSMKHAADSLLNYLLILHQEAQLRDSLRKTYADAKLKNYQSLWPGTPTNTSIPEIKYQYRFRFKGTVARDC